MRQAVDGCAACVQSFSRRRPPFTDCTPSPSVYLNLYWLPEMQAL